MNACLFFGMVNFAFIVGWLGGYANGQRSRRYLMDHSTRRLREEIEWREKYVKEPR